MHVFWVNESQQFNTQDKGACHSLLYSFALCRTCSSGTSQAKLVA